MSPSQVHKAPVTDVEKLHVAVVTLMDIIEKARPRGCWKLLDGTGEVEGGVGADGLQDGVPEGFYDAEEPPEWDAQPETGWPDAPEGIDEGALDADDWIFSQGTWLCPVIWRSLSEAEHRERLEEVAKMCKLALWSVGAQVETKESGAK